MLGALMGAVITVANLKGGAGKTTLALSLVAAWRHKGLRSVLVDADPQKTATEVVGCGAELGADVPELVQLGDWRLLRRQVQALAGDYARVVVDTPPQLGKTSSAAISASDLVLIPVSPGAHGLYALGPTLDLVDEWNALAEVQPRVALVLNALEHTRIGRDHRAAVEALLAEREDAPMILDAELWKRTCHPEAQTAGQTPVTYEPRGVAAQEVLALADEVGRRRLLRRGTKRGTRR